MTFTLSVHEPYQSLLGAITHVDGSARVQTVSETDNLLYWKLIEAFGQLTGVPMLLNTSFNNHAEPIVDSPTDAIVCFLTTGLDCLVVHNYVLEKKPVDVELWWNMHIALPPYVLPRENADLKTYYLANSFNDRVYGVSYELYEILKRADGMHSLSDLIQQAGLTIEDREALLKQVFSLWSLRLLRLSPVKAPIHKDLVVSLI
jgi:carbamoyltransferase